MITAFTRRRRSAFTLVELLTVMAIIGILAAIIIPALSGSRERSRRAVCQNNLSQIGRGFMMYADANKEYLPMASMDGTVSIWDLAVLPYVGNATNIMFCPSDPLWRQAMAEGAPRTYAVNAVPDDSAFDDYRVPFGQVARANSALRMSDLDFNKGDIILASERLAEPPYYGLVGSFAFCTLDFHKTTVHSGKGGNYLMGSMAVKYMETNNAALSIPEGNRGNPWTVYVGN